jgi:hypothetical protein
MPGERGNILCRPDCISMITKNCITMNYGEVSETQGELLDRRLRAN